MRTIFCRLKGNSALVTHDSIIATQNYAIIAYFHSIILSKTNQFVCIYISGLDKVRILSEFYILFFKLQNQRIVSLKGHSLCKQCLHNLQFMKKGYSSPKVSKLARADISCRFMKTRSLCRTVYNMNGLSQIMALGQNFTLF